MLFGKGAFSIEMQNKTVKMPLIRRQCLVGRGRQPSLVQVRRPADACVSLCGNVIFICWKAFLQWERRPEWLNWIWANLRWSFFSLTLSYSLSLSIALPILPPHTLFFPVSIVCKDVVVRNSISPVAAFIICCVKRCFEAPSPSLCWAFCCAGEVRAYVNVQHCVECVQWCLDILNDRLRQTYDNSTLL